MGYRNDIELNDDLIQFINNLNDDNIEIFKYIYSHQTEIRTLIAKNKNLSAKNLHTMRNDTNIFVRAALAQNPNLDDADIIFLSKDLNVLVVSSIAANQKLPLKLIEDFVADKSYMVRRAIASNKFLEKNQLVKFSEDQNWGVREQVALNESTPAEILDQLAEDKSREVVEAVASNRNALRNTLEKLSTKDENLRDIVLANESLDESLLEEIFESVSGDVDDESEDSNLQYRAREIIAKRVNLSRKFINLLINDSEAGVRESLAGNKILTINDLEKLAMDTDQGVRKAVFENPNSNESIKASVRLMGLENE